MAPSASATSPGSPEVTQPGIVVFNEDFENGTDNSALGAQSYSAPRSTSYVGAAGERYTGSPAWIDGARCNGVILSYDNSDTPPWAASGTVSSGTNNRCADLGTVRSYQFLRMLAKGMGQQFTPASANTNHVSSSYTECVSTNVAQGTCGLLPAGPVNGVMFRTVKPLATTPGHYYTFGIDTAYMNCRGGSADPSYQFARVDAASALTPIGDPLNGCTSTTDPNVRSYRQNVTSDVGGLHGTVTRAVNINSMTTNQSFQATSPSMGLALWNNNGTTNGNDGAFDNVRLIDVTPQLDASFSPSLIAPGGTSTLTLTVTNTSELNAKNDFSVTDTLPPGLVVARTPAVGGTCKQSADAPLTVSAKAGASVVSVTGGDLSKGTTSCTITVEVATESQGTYVNGPANLVTNLNPPADHALVVRAPRLTLTMALGAPRLSDADQFTPEIHSGSATGPVVNATANATTTGSGSTVTAGSGVAGQMVADVGTAYYLTESGGNLPGYDKAITCTDTNGLQPGLPSGAAFVGSLTVVPVAGADITCVLTNTALPTPPPPPAPAMEFSMTAVLSAKAGPSHPGDRITYELVAKNTGKVRLTRVSIGDQMTGLSVLVYTWPGTPGELLPGETVLATATYAITQADIDAGHIANVASTTGAPPAGPAISPPPAGTDTPLWPSAALEFSKTADASAVGDPAKVGDTIIYTFTAKNTGNITLPGVAIQDAMPGLSALVYTWPGTPGELKPGESVTATATYAITQTDVSAGYVSNKATVSAEIPAGSGATASPASVVVTFPPVVPGQSAEPLASTGVVLTVLWSSLVVVGAGLFLLLMGRRKRSEVQDTAARL